MPSPSAALLSAVLVVLVGGCLSSLTTPDCPKPRRVALSSGTFSRAQQSPDDTGGVASGYKNATLSADVDRGLVSIRYQNRDGKAVVETFRFRSAPRYTFDADGKLLPRAD